MTGNNHRGIILQDRDLKLLSELAVMRVADREQAKRVAGFRSTTRVNKRLLALTRRGLLRRFFLGTVAGGRKGLYALSKTGAMTAEVPYGGPRRPSDQVLVADFFVTHQLFINQIYCQVKYPLQPNEAIRFIRWQTFSKSLEAAGSLIPDGYFEFASSGRTHAAFLEVDLGHEGHAVWKTKLQAYLRYALSGHFAEHFREQQFRVLVVTTSDRRMHSLRATVAAITEKIFWFSTFDSLDRDGFWSSVWFRPKGNERQALA